MAKGGGSETHGILYDMFREMLKLSEIIFPGPTTNVISDQLPDL